MNNERSVLDKFRLRVSGLALMTVTSVVLCPILAWPQDESAPEEMSFPALAPRATPIPSVRGLRRTRRNGSNAGLHVSLFGSNRVTCHLALPS
jgi:hypothetical protein